MLGKGILIDTTRRDGFIAKIATCLHVSSKFKDNNIFNIITM